MLILPYRDGICMITFFVFTLHKQSSKSRIMEKETIEEIRDYQKLNQVGTLDAILNAAHSATLLATGESKPEERLEDLATIMSALQLFHNLVEEICEK